MCPADEAIALFVWDTDCVRTQDEVMSDSEAAAVLALIGHMPADVWQEEGITFATVQNLWSQEWAARDAGQPVPEAITRTLGMAAQVRTLMLS